MVIKRITTGDDGLRVQMPNPNLLPLLPPCLCDLVTPLVVCFAIRSLYKWPPDLFMLLESSNTGV